jgi:hypothetical protein
MGVPRRSGPSSKDSSNSRAWVGRCGTSGRASSGNQLAVEQLPGRVAQVSRATPRSTLDASNTSLPPPPKVGTSKAIAAAAKG